MTAVRPAALAAGLLCAFLPAGQPAAQAAGSGPRAPLAGRAAAVNGAALFNGTAAVGALFTATRTGLRHFCTAAVVRSKHGNVVITAAHCLEGRQIGPRGDVIFAPGYHDGQFPHGRWQVMAQIADASWRRTRDVNDDVAFLVVGRAGHQVQKYTGAETVATATRLPRAVRVIGYPDRSAAPLRCAGQATALRLKGYRQLVFRCAGFTDGTSGGPFLARAPGRPGYTAVIGVIGGYEHGGRLAGVSYSARFLRNVAALYRRAELD
jgi:V8-like Glu-specific endopeptidase